MKIRYDGHVKFEPHELHDTLEAAKAFADTEEAPRWFGQEIWLLPDGKYVVKECFDCKPHYSQGSLSRGWLPICWRFNEQEWRSDQR